jgi:hypothetical protein
MNVILPLLQQFKDNRWFKQVGCIEGEFSKTITLNLPTTNLGQQLYFNSDTELDNAIIKTIEVVISTNQINTIYQNSTLDTISSGLATKAMLTLSNNSREVISQMPLYTLIRSLNQGKPSYFYIDNIIWQNCYIELLNTAGFSTVNGFFIRVTYDRKDTF